MLQAAAQERLHGLAPTFLAAAVVHIAIAPLLGVKITQATYIAEGLVVTLLGLLTVAIMLRRIPLGWTHAAFAGVLWACIAATVVPMYLGPNPEMMYLLILEVTGAGILLHTGWTIATVVIVDAVVIPVILAAGVASPAVAIAALMTSNAFGIVIHRVIQGTVLRAEVSRIAEAETARQLASQLGLLERSRVEQGHLQDQLLHSQRMEAVGTLAAGMAHDMNNVLAAVSGLTTLALEEVGDVQTRDDLEQVLTQAERGATLTRGLLAYSRRGQYRQVVVPLEHVVDEVLPLLHRTLPRTIELASDLDLGGAHVRGDRHHLGQVLINLAINASDAMGGTGRLRIVGRTTYLVGHPLLPGGDYARLEVIDTGHGMDAATSARIFEPFFTTKAAGKGTGLGLSTAWGIVQSHGGAIDVESSPGHGTRFVVHLPVTLEDVARARPTPALGVIPRVTVLVIDDEPAVRATTCRLLERMGVLPISADGGAAGLRLFAERAADIRLVILDMGMPEMGGAECFARLREISDVPVLIATGYAIDAEVRRLVADGARLIEKPYTPADLRHEVAASIASIAVASVDAVVTASASAGGA